MLVSLFLLGLYVAFCHVLQGYFMISESVIHLSHWQFTLTSLYQFLFIPLIVGLSLVLAIMESIYIMTGRKDYKAMTIFWGKLFGINFVIFLLMKLIIAAQFAMNWSYLSYYVGDILGASFTIETLIIIFLQVSLVGLFIFGWNKFNKGQHLVITWLMAISSIFMLGWLLITNHWMKNPIGIAFNYQTMRMELTDIEEIIFNPTIYAELIQVITLSCLLTAIFILAVSAYYLLKECRQDLAKPSFIFSANFGLIATLLIVIIVNFSQVLPNTSFSSPSLIDSAKILETNRQRIHNGIKAHNLLDKLRDTQHEAGVLEEFNLYKKDLAYGLLLKQSLENITEATEEQIELAAQFSLPVSPPSFWSPKIRLISWFISLIIFINALIASLIFKYRPSWSLKISLYSLPLLWIAYLINVVIHELAYQPWAVKEVIPIFLSPSSLSEPDLWLSLVSYLITYILFISAEIILMLKFINQSSKPTNNQHHSFEMNAGETQ